MKNKMLWFKIAGDDDEQQDNVAIINSSWCVNRSGICVSFAIPINVMSINEITNFGDQFIKAIKASYKKLLNDNFYAKTDTPVINATDKGQIIMLWSFQGDESDQLKKQLKDNGIKEIVYE